jgi:hypothetical protein
VVQAAAGLEEHTLAPPELRGPQTQAAAGAALEEAERAELAVLEWLLFLCRPQITPALQLARRQ